MAKKVVAPKLKALMMANMPMKGNDKMAKGKKITKSKGTGKGC